MNLVSAMVGISIAGIAAPTILEMSVTPIIAQKRAKNFSEAESAAVIFAATNEGASDVASPPDNCDLDSTNPPAYTITCKHGTGKYMQTVSRSFRTAIIQSRNSQNGMWEYPEPSKGFTHIECHAHENWGINTDAFDMENNVWVKKSCMPSLIRGNNGTNYHASDINSWKYNINNWNGWGDHKDYQANNN